MRWEGHPHERLIGVLVCAGVLAFVPALLAVFFVLSATILRGA
jgi:hypothetical protein